MTDNVCTVKVSVRVRPLIKTEIYKTQECVSVDEDRNLLFFNNDKQYEFDHVQGKDSSQVRIQNELAIPLLDQFQQGQNATIFAQGQTSSGKTFTMGTSDFRDEDEDKIGIISRSIIAIYQYKESKQNDWEIKVSCTYLEIQNEELRDLIDPVPKTIVIKESPKVGIYCDGLVSKEIKDEAECFKYLETGGSQRSTSATLMNETSSRSHAIFTIYTELSQIKDLNDDGEAVAEAVDMPEEYLNAKFHFVDLAGSERLKKTGATGSTAREGISINKGLHTLGNVISSLVAKSKHVPYRDSKLTRILTDSLGGNSRTTMIACISPAEVNFEESNNTLKQAARARMIENKPIKNKDPLSNQISQLRNRISELETEIRWLIGVVEQSDLKEELKKRKINVTNTVNSKIDLAGYHSTNAKQPKGSQVVNNANTRSLNLQQQALVQSLNDALNQERVASACVARERDIALLKSNELTRLLKETMGAEEFEKANAQLECADVSTDVTQRHEAEVLELKTEVDRLKLQNENLNGDVERLMKEQEALQQIHFDKLEDGYHTDPNKNEDANYEELLKNFAAVVGDQNKQEDLKQEQQEKEENQLSQIKSDKQALNYLESAENSNKDEQASQLNQLKLLQQSIQRNMDMQYSKKIQQLRTEIDQVKQQRDDQIEKLKRSKAKGGAEELNKLQNKFMSDINHLQTQVHEYKKKEAELQDLLKLSRAQRSKINTLNESIRKIKSEEMQLKRKILLDHKSYQQWKTDKTKELRSVKQENSKKENQIKQLTKDLDRLNVLMAKKQSEITQLGKKKEESKKMGDTGDMRRGIDSHVDLILMESQGKKRVDLLRTEVSSLTEDLESAKRERSKLQLKKDRIEKDIQSGITYYHNGDSLEEMLHYYALQIENLTRDIESRAETKNQKEKQIANISEAVTKKSEAFSNTWQVESLVNHHNPKDILNQCLETLANTKLEKLENEGKLVHTHSQQKDADSRIQELMNNIRELDARNKQEVAELRKEFAREKTSLIHARHQDAMNNLEPIEEVAEHHEHDTLKDPLTISNNLTGEDSLQVENSELFNKLEEERKKNALLEETLRSMRKKFKEDIDGLSTRNTELKQSQGLLEKDQKAIKDKNVKRKEKLVEMRNIFQDDNPDIATVPNATASANGSGTGSARPERDRSTRTPLEERTENGGNDGVSTTTSSRPMLNRNDETKWKSFMEVEQPAQVRALSSFGGQLQAACKNSVKIWDAAKMREVNQLNFAEKATVRSLVAERSSKSLQVGVSNEIAQQDILSLLCLNKVRINSSVQGLGVMPENSILAASTKSEIRIYDTKNWNILGQLKNNKEGSVHVHDNQIVQAGRDQHMQVQELRKNQTLSFDIGENNENEILALNVIDGKILCCTSSFGLEAQDLKTLDKVSQMDCANDQKNISRVSADAKLNNLFCVDQGTVRWWEKGDTSFEERGDFHVGSGVSAIEPMNPDDNNVWLATANNEKVLSLWSKDQ